MANGMASLFVGTTGLKTAQTALNTTAHNLSNINTDGYTRQQVTFQDTTYVNLATMKSVNSTSYGLGVNVEEVRRIRDNFIDKAYRSENSRLGYYESQSKAVEEVEDLFGEMQGVTYESYLVDLYDSINELAKNPTSTVARSSLIQNATAFVEKSENIYKGMRDYQTTLNTEVKNMVDKINTLGETIYTLNKKIAKVEAAGIEDANDLRDQRDSALDELSEYINISYYEADNSEVIVTAENVPFVTMGELAKMDVRYVEGTSLVVPTWPGYERDVYNDEDTGDNTQGTDKGELKGLIVARGSMIVDYTDVPVMPDTADYDMTTADGQAAYENAYNQYKEKQEYYDKYIEPSVMLSAIAGFDKLVNGIVEDINNVLCPEKQVTLTSEYTDDSGNAIQADTYTYNAVAEGNTSTGENGDAVLYDRYGREVAGTDNGDGTYTFISDEKLYTLDGTAVAANSYTYSVLDTDKTGYGMDDDQTIGTELFKRQNTERYTTITDADGSKLYVRNNLNEAGYESKYTLGNLEMNPVATQNVATIPLSTIQGKENFDRAEELLDIWDNNFASLDPENYAKTDYMTFYNNFISEYATMGSVLDNYVTNQNNMVDGYDSQRLETEGVSSDEELEKMIKYQHAYNASSRYINVVSEMLEHLVTSLGNS